MMESNHNKEINYKGAGLMAKEELLSVGVDP